MHLALVDAVLEHVGRFAAPRADAVAPSVACPTALHLSPVQIAPQATAARAPAACAVSSLRERCMDLLRAVVSTPCCVPLP
eukprot:9020072-Pyramimonas_sp.AAC.1